MNPLFTFNSYFLLFLGILQKFFFLVECTLAGIEYRLLKILENVISH